MALTDESMNNMVMPVSPMYGGGSGFGDFGGSGAFWILLLFILLGNGAWGNGGGYGSGSGQLYPWMNQSNQINDGFRDQMLNTSINGIQSGVTGIQTQLCNGFAGVNATVQNGFAQAEIADNARQMANMQTAFAGQTAMSQGFNALGTQFADCCCENRLGLADLKYTVATENCADRTQSMQNTRDIIDSQNRGTQAILDKLCALELDGVKSQLAQAQRENLGLQNQVNMATMRESQTAQTAQILAGQAAEIDGVYNRLKNCPVPSMPVYGNTPIFTCPQNAYSGCGCNGGNF
jgi:hypothetical protein